MQGARLVLPVLLAAAVASAPPVQQANAPVADEVQRLEREWNDAHLRADGDAMDRLCADDLVVIVPGMKPMTKAESIGVLRSGRMKFERYETSEVEVHLYGDVAIALGRLRRTRSRNGTSAEDDWRFTKTYARRNGRWQVVVFHASPAAE